MEKMLEVHWKYPGEDSSTLKLDLRPFNNVERKRELSRETRERMGFWISLYVTAREKEGFFFSLEKKKKPPFLD